MQKESVPHERACQGLAGLRISVLPLAWETNVRANFLLSLCANTHISVELPKYIIIVLKLFGAAQRNVCLIVSGIRVIDWKCENAEQVDQFEQQPHNYMLRSKMIEAIAATYGQRIGGLTESSNP